jgi:hypothetical protein
MVIEHIVVDANIFNHVIISKSQAPAFADLLAEQVLWQARAASRRQANNQTITKILMTEIPNKIKVKIIFGVRTLGNLNLFGICLPAGRQGIWLLEFNL